MIVENDEMYFTVFGDDGKETLCETLFTFDCDETNKTYIVYTDNEIDNEGNTKVYASAINPTDDILLPIETDREWCIIEAILDELKKNSDDE